MNATSPTFYLFLVATTLAFHALKRAHARQAVILTASVLFARSFAQGWLDLAPIAVFLAIGFVLVRVAAAARSRHVVLLAVIIYVATFMYLKRVAGFGVGVLGFDYAVIGMSYMLFRTIHLVVDCSMGDVDEPPSPLGFLLYTLNLYCLVSGPIQFWSEFRETSWTGSAYLTPAFVFQRVSRVTIGLFKLAVVAAGANYLFENVSVQLIGGATASSHAASTVKYAVAAGAYTAYLYYNFSGYMDIVIASGALVGQKIPENFDRPFASSGFLDFWQHWHITLSRWFKAYVFTPLLIALMRVPAFGDRAVLVGLFCFFTTFLLMGMWHGNTSVFVIYGLFMGLGASLNKSWNVGMQAALGRPSYRALCAHPAYAHACRAATFAYFALALTGLWIGSTARLGRLLSDVSPLGVVGAFVMLAAVFGLCFPVIVQVRSLAGRIAALIPSSATGANLLVASRIVSVVLIMGLLSKTPDFVYGAY